jgi:imidazolonepropionase-like amidohydrolase
MLKPSIRAALFWLGLIATLIVVLFALFTYTAALYARYEQPNDLFDSQSVTAGNTHYVVEPVSIIDVDKGHVATKRQLVIADGIIIGIHEAGHKIPQGFVKIDGNDAYVAPGLIDMHTHIVDRKDLVNSLAHGVTSVRNMRGMPMHLRFKFELNNRQWLGSNLYTSSPILDNAKSDIFQHALDSPEHASSVVRAHKQAGYDLLKVYSRLPKPILDALLQEAEKQSIPVAKHGSYGSITDQGFDMTALKKLQSVEHVEEIYQTVLNFDLDADALDHHLKQIKKSNTFLTPTLATFDHLTELSAQKNTLIKTLELERMNPFYRFLLSHLSVQRWLDASPKQVDWNIAEREILFDITKRADQLGVPLLVGSDQGTMYLLSGESTHQEMHLMQRAGLTPQTILRSATLNAAKALQIDNQLGSVSVGKRADLILVKKNPLDDVAHLTQLVAVIKHGQLIDSSGLQTLNHIGKKPAGWVVGFGYLAESILVRFGLLFSTR